MLLKTFGWSLGLTIVALVGALVLGGPTTLAVVAVLIVLEVSLSFDNAVVNATVLERMSEPWRRIFLTVGVLIAVFGMRLVFPLLIVGITAHLGPVEAVRLALDGGSVDEPGTYAHLLHDAHPSIAAFGGMFLAMLFLDFVLTEREHAWLSWLERPLARLGRLDNLAVVIALVALVVAAQTLAEHPTTVLVSGVLGVIAYLVVGGLSAYFEAKEDQATAQAVLATGRAAFFMFCYLEVLDASFSFDGVIGAFAITQDIFVIATGLGVGALYIRSLTVYLVHQGTLGEYVHLEHGAHWAIGALATVLLISIRYEVPEVVTGLIGVVFIALSLGSSIRRRRALSAAG
jgi:uncharacterized protein